MLDLFRFVVALALLVPAVTAPPAAAQQAGGGRIAQRDTFVDSNVLTPGEVDDWPLTARDGETLIVAVESDEFDPALDVVDPTGKVVASNDDVRPGDQNPSLVVRLDKGGEYKVLVKSFKGKVGGTYELTVRRFLAVETPLGARLAGVLGALYAQWHRVEAAAGQTLVVTARSAAFTPQIQVFSPDGEYLGASVAAGSGGTRQRLVFRAVKAGRYHARVAASSGGSPQDSYTVTVATARVFPLTIGATEPAKDIDAGGLDLWTFKAVGGEVVRIQARATGVGMTASIAFVPPLDERGEPRQPEGPPAVVLLPSDPKTGGDLVALLNHAGTYQVEVSQPLGLAARYTFAASRPVKQIGPKDGAASVLDLGGSEFWEVEGKAAAIVRYDARSEQFDPVLELYGPRGVLVTSNDDGAGGRNARLTALLVEPGRYLLRVGAYGGGGSGAYGLDRLTNFIKPTQVGTRVEGTVGAGASEIWSITGRAGQVVIVNARSSDFDPRVSVIGPDAAEVAADDDGGEGTDSLLSVSLPVDGTYTIWVSAKAGGGLYTLRLLDGQ